MYQFDDLVHLFLDNKTPTTMLTERDRMPQLVLVPECSEAPLQAAILNARVRYLQSFFRPIPASLRERACGGHDAEAKASLARAALGVYILSALRATLPDFPFPFLRKTLPLVFLGGF